MATVCDRAEILSTLGVTPEELDVAVPIYLQIAADLRAKIKAGTLRPGTQLPSEQQLQNEYAELFRRPDNVSRNTVRDAIELLVRERQIERRPGQGTFIPK
jgi:DNA-binding GntR family transcriptional regulator